MLTQVPAGSCELLSPDQDKVLLPPFDCFSRERSCSRATVGRGVRHMIYGISTVHCISSWQLHKPDIIHLSILWLLGALFKKEEIAPGENKWRCTSKNPREALCQFRRAGEREHRDVGMVGSITVPSGLFLGKLYSEFLHVAFICPLNNPPIL